MKLYCKVGIIASCVWFWFSSDDGSSNLACVDFWCMNAGYQLSEHSICMRSSCDLLKRIFPKFILPLQLRIALLDVLILIVLFFRWRKIDWAILGDDPGMSRCRDSWDSGTILRLPKVQFAGRRRSCWGTEQSPGAPRQAPACRAEHRSTWARIRWTVKSRRPPGRGDRGRDRSLPGAPGRDRMDEDDVLLFFNKAFFN
jgi:hypothetical protein